MVTIYWDYVAESTRIEVVDSSAVKQRIATEMQGNRGVITVGARGGHMVIIDTAKIRMVQ